MNRVRFHIDVRPAGADQSLSGYPKHAADEIRAHALAEQAARDLETANKPGEYLVTVSLEGKAPVSSQVVIVTPRASSSATLAIN